MTTTFFSSFIIFLTFSSVLLSSLSETITTRSGVLDRTTKQQIISTIPPGTPSTSSEPFLTSPLSKYSAYLLRTTSSPTSGGFGNDFCYIQIQSTESSEPVWESECTPISTANACSLLFTDDGLAIYDGSTLQWDNGAESADGNPIQKLELVDEGDMRLRDDIGELAWSASEDPRVNQRCGQPGSPGLGPALPPFAQPIGDAQTNLPFGQEGAAGTAGNYVGDAASFDNNGGNGREFGLRWVAFGWTLLLPCFAFLF